MNIRNPNVWPKLCTCTGLLENQYFSRLLLVIAELEKFLVPDRTRLCVHAGSSRACVVHIYVKACYLTKNHVTLLLQINYIDIIY